MQFIKAAKVADKYKMHLPHDVARELGVEPGDHIVFYKDKGQVVVKKG